MTTVHNATGGNADAPSTAPAPELDPVLLAHEADQAWEAHQHVLRQLSYVQARLREREREHTMHGPHVSAFEQVSSEVYNWALGGKTAEDAMKTIKAAVERARKRYADLSL